MFHRIPRFRAALLAAAVVLAACSGDASQGGGGADSLGDDQTESEVGTASTGETVGAGDEQTESADDTEAGEDGPDGDGDGATDAEETADPASTVTIEGQVTSAVDGTPLDDAMVSVGELAATTDADGRYVLEGVNPGATLTVERPVWRTASVPLDDVLNEKATSDEATDTVDVALEPVVVRGLRVSAQTAGDPERFADLLTLSEETVVNALVFDTKDESNRVLYATEVEFAADIGAVDPVYEPAELLAQARELDLYAVTRIVTFEDGGWADAAPDAKLAGNWVDAADEKNWAYPLDLAVEACEIGFDEVQFDYVRFPAGRTAEIARPDLPPTSEARAAVIERFLGEARDRLHPMGCGVSAAIFGIVMSSETDEGIGQTPETVSSVVDAVSPMLYPSHYGPGWLGFADPNDHPGPVIAHALDTGEPKVAPGVLVRPWIQGFSYNGAQVMAQIEESEARGAGWIIWNFSGNYRRDWLPSG